MPGKRYNDLGSFLRKRFGCKVYKVSVKADLTCPNRDGTKGYRGCIYCSTDTLVPSTYTADMPIRDQLDQGIAYLKRKYKADKFIAYFQSYSNTYAPLNTLEGLYLQAVDHPDVVGLAISTRPDCVDDSILDLISEIGKKKFVWMEYGLQSSSDKTLELLNRGHNLKDFLDSLDKTNSRGIPVCVHVIIGLPGEKRKDILDTARLLGRLAVWGVKIHHLEVHRGTKLEEMYRKGDIRVSAIEEYISLVAAFLEYISPQTIIHRLCSDTPKRYLVAPEWEGGKFTLIRKIEEFLDKRDIYQGAKC
ncbi:MAG: TIGR01212 family radical SAM protein [Thermodesulfobacteriota bacterium]